MVQFRRKRMSKDREKQKAAKQEKIYNLQLEMRQAYKDKNPKLANEIMKKIKELRGCVKAE